MADHVTVDLAKLGEVAAGLGSIASTLQGSDLMSLDLQVFGQAGLASVMGEVAGNWRVHREHLVSSVQAHQKLTQAAVEAYTKLDNGLADALAAPASSGTPTGPGGPR